MPQFLLIAERVYKKFEEQKLFSEDMIEHLNSLVSIIRLEIKDTSYKLKYNFIDFIRFPLDPTESLNFRCTDPSGVTVQHLHVYSEYSY